MDDFQLDIETRLEGLSREKWQLQVSRICKLNGFFDRMHKRHYAGFLRAGNRLLVTFEDAEKLRDFAQDAEPRGFAYARHEGWSVLALFSEGRSWFREPEIYAFFDRLQDDGFFDDFEQVLFYGGDGGESYAAAAYSVSAPGATVVVVRPQATLEAEVTSWDRRYFKERKQDFRSRYGYAPAMLEAADHAFIIYDPYVQLDACHAALFRREHVTLLPCPLFGDALDRTFDRMGINDLIIKLAMDQVLDRRRFAQLIRARRYDPTYTRDLVGHLLDRDHVWLAQLLCAYMIRRDRTGFFKSTLEDIADGAPHGRRRRRP